MAAGSANDSAAGEMMNEMAWQSLMASLGFKANTDVYEFLLTQYNHRGRKYHNQTHIDAVLADLTQVRFLVEDYESVALALWFHDVIYNIFSSSNELDSANRAVIFLQNNAADLDFSARVFELIKATQHQNIPSRVDEKIVVDIDLAILGSSASEYQRFEADIRQEYKIVPGFFYCRKRIAVLQSFLEREYVYSHEYFRDRLESAARRNIAKAIDDLQRS